MPYYAFFIDVAHGNGDYGSGYKCIFFGQATEKQINTMIKSYKEKGYTGIVTKGKQIGQFYCRY